MTTTEAGDKTYFKLTYMSLFINWANQFSQIKKVDVLSNSFYSYTERQKKD